MAVNTDMTLDDLRERNELLEAEVYALQMQLAAARAAALPIVEPLSRGWRWTMGGRWFVAYWLKDTRRRHVITHTQIELLARALGLIE